MPKNRYSQRISEETWESHKHIILRLYLSENKPLTAPGGVRDTINAQHGFSATKAQYETRLKKWGCYKYAGARDRHTKAPVLDDVGADSLVTERRKRKTDKDILAESNSYSQNIAIRASSPHPSLPNPPSPRFSSSSQPGGWNSISSFRDGAFGLPSPMSYCEIESLISQSPGWTPNTTPGAPDSFHPAWQTYPDLENTLASSVDFDDSELHGGSGGLIHSPNAWHARGFVAQTDTGTLIQQDFLEDQFRLEIILSSGVSVPDFAISIIPAITRIFQRTMSPTPVIILGNSNAFDFALRKTCPPGTLELVRRQSMDHQIIYMIFHRLINDGDAFLKLRQPRKDLDRLFKAGIEYCFSLEKSVLSGIIKSTPPPYDLALIQNMYHAALVMGDGPVLSVILEMDRTNLKHQPLPYTFSMRSPLEYACSNGHFQVTKVLLDHGADPNSLLSGNSHPQSISTMLRKSPNSDVGFRIRQLLIERGLEFPPDLLAIEMQDCSDDDLPLLVAHSLSKSFEIFFHHEALLSVLMRPELDNSFSTILKTILDKAFLQRNGRKDDWNSVLSTSLFIAIQGNHKTAVDILLARGATPNIECLIMAAQNNNVQILEDFLDRGLDPNTRFQPTGESFTRTRREPGDWSTALSESIKQRSREAFQLLQSRGFVSNLSYQPAGFSSAFMAACQVGDSDLIEQLLSLPNIQLRHLRSPKHIEAAMEEDQYHIVEKLLSLGLVPSIWSLASAIRKRQLAIVIRMTRLMNLPHILDAQEGYYDYSLSKGYDNALLWEALRWGNNTVIEHILKAGHPVQVAHENLQGWDPASGLETPNQRGQWIHSPLGAAILTKNIAAVKTLMALGTNFVSYNTHHTSYQSQVTFSATNKSRGWMLTPLAATIVVDDLSLFREVLRMGTDPFDNTALFVCAVLDSEVAFVASLLSTFNSRYPDGAPFFGSDALYRIMRRGKTRLLELLAKDADLTGPVIEDPGCVKFPRSKFETKFTSPLGEAVHLHAANEDAGEVLDYLLPLVKDLNAVVHGTWKHGNMTSILYAIHLHSLKTVQKLHQAGADISLPAEWLIPRTPLQAAAEAGSISILDYLLGQGVHPDEAPADRRGATALQLAAITGNVAIATTLLNAGADVNAPRALCEGRTAFEGATEHGRIEMMIFLVNHGADLVSNSGEQYRRAIGFAEENLNHAAKALADELYSNALANLEAFPLI
ncbi:ankyrin repeat-containing protein [Stemphylium lycopersici]|nr:ankyrin repeat-containing protein [Stemphylium lycopersici]RAR00017.1 ankyrin repeat-containing protein [Stemphylium lycopersici]